MADDRARCFVQDLRTMKDECPDDDASVAASLKRLPGGNLWNGLGISVGIGGVPEV